MREVTFVARLGVNHDMIDPDQVDAQTGRVYPVLIRLARGEALPPGVRGRLDPISFWCIRDGGRGYDRVQLSAV